MSREGTKIRSNASFICGACARDEHIAFVGLNLCGCPFCGCIARRIVPAGESTLPSHAIVQWAGVPGSREDQEDT